MNAFKKYERKREEELTKLPEKVETVEQALDAIERIALNSYKDIMNIEVTSIVDIPLYIKLFMIRERLLNIAHLVDIAKHILQEQKRDE
ncbi:MAG: hypothetical protein RQ842_08305 [Vulcanisaeta sp.]|nr:hypothetical protein [Vulcanisaeta sp.]